MMEQFSEFFIPFAGLKEGVHQFDFKLNNKFFEKFDFVDFQKAQIQVNLALEKKITLLKFNLKKELILKILRIKSNYQKS